MHENCGLLDLLANNRVYASHIYTFNVYMVPQRLVECVWVHLEKTYNVIVFHPHKRHIMSSPRYWIKYLYVSFPTLMVSFCPGCMWLTSGKISGLFRVVSPNGNFSSCWKEILRVDYLFEIPSTGAIPSSFSPRRLSMVYLPRPMTSNISKSILIFSRSGRSSANVGNLMECFGLIMKFSPNV